MQQEEFEQRVIALQDTLYRVSATILYRPCDRDDAIQECVCKALSRRSTLRDDAALTSWLIRILINECYAILRRARREHPADQLPEPEPQPDPEADPDIFRALYSLSEKLRLPIVLHYVEGYPVKQIAAMLRIPTGTVKSRLARGREQMKTAYLTRKEDMP